MAKNASEHVMAGLDPAIHENNPWIPGSSPGMTVESGAILPRTLPSGRSAQKGGYSPAAGFPPPASSAS